MKIAPKHFRRLAVAALAYATAASAGAPYEVVAPAVETSGGALAGGAYTAITTLATVDAAVVMAGGVFEATGGVERRRLDTRDDALFADGYE